MKKYIDFLNTLTRSLLVEKIFLYGHPVMIYGSFFFPFIAYLLHEQKTFGSIAWVFLVIIMLVRPLADIFPDIHLLRKLISVRRGMGIVSGMAALTHGIGAWFIPARNGTVVTVANIVDFGQPYIYGSIALVFSTLLLITSNNFSVKLLGKKWKWLQRGVYGMFYIVCIHVAFIGGRGVDPGTLCQAPLF